MMLNWITIVLQNVVAHIIVMRLYRIFEGNQKKIFTYIRVMLFVYINDIVAS